MAPPRAYYPVARSPTLHSHGTPIPYPTTPGINSKLFTEDLELGSASSSALSPCATLPRGLKSPRTMLLVVCLLVCAAMGWNISGAGVRGWTERVEGSESWNLLYEASMAGWREYEPPPSSALLDSSGESSPRSSSSEAWPLESADRWIAQGELGAEMKRKFKEREKVALVVTYVNGSDALLAHWKGVLTSVLTPNVRPEMIKFRAVQTANHFRDHDELRYAIRSAFTAFDSDSVSKLSLITTDIPTNTLPSGDPSLALGPSDLATQLPLVSSSRIGQVPTWLRSASSSHEAPPIRTIHHSSFFANKSLVPSFSSLSIESQFSRLTDISEFMLYLNDDTFLLGKDSFTAADVGSPLYGPVFRVQRNFVVPGLEAGIRKANEVEGEWPSLRRANYLLDRRFGKRDRAYLAHIPKTFSMPLLSEVESIWSDELSRTASSRFRGLGVEYQTSFLATHYIIESHRLALLWSFFILRSDPDLNGELSMYERQTMLQDLGFTSDEQKSIQGRFVKRRSKEALKEAFGTTGLKRPKATKIAFTSLDGYGLFSRPQGYPSNDSTSASWPVLEFELSSDPVCSFDLDVCLPAGFADRNTPITTQRIMQQVAFKRRECGDCAILLLVAKSGQQGLEAFLPRRDSSAEITKKGLFFPPNKDYHDFVWSSITSSSTSSSSSSLRQTAIHQIQRYSYVLGESTSTFLSMRVPAPIDKFLSNVTHPSNGVGAFLTLNDDLASVGASRMVKRIIRKWGMRMWPDKIKGWE